MQDTLGDRMKKYEYVTRTYLPIRTPTIIRIDGKAFHTFTKGFVRPVDDVLVQCMQQTAKVLCANIEGCKLAYVQSDEISLLLTDYDNLNTNAWFDKNIQKMVSVSASIATLAFNREFNIQALRSGDKKYFDKKMLALFDSRVFTLPKEEVCNYFVWRQQDATRNAIQMLGQMYFKPLQMNGWSCNDIQDALMVQKEINFNDLSTPQKRGVCIRKKYHLVNDTERGYWDVDEDIPIFSKDRDYIERFVFIDERD